MSGRRCKALKAAFAKRHGRPVERTAWRRDGIGGWRYMVSEWRRIKRGLIPVALLLGFLWSHSASAADLCRDASGRFTSCPEPVVEPDVVPADCRVEGCPARNEDCRQIARDGTFGCVLRGRSPATDEAPLAKASGARSLSVRAAAGGLTALATDAPASVQPMASVQVSAPLSTSDRGPSLDVQADLTALPGETVSLGDPQTFKALEMSIGVSQPLGGPLLFSIYGEGGFASRLATGTEPVSRLPAWWSAGLLFRTSDRAHSLKVGMGGDQRLSGEWAPAVHVSGTAKVAERAGVSMYLVGSLVRALDLSAYGYKPPARDSLRIGMALGL